MLPHIDDYLEADPHSGRAPPRAAATHHELSVHRQPRRPLHPMVVSVLMFLIIGTAFYGAEMFAPTRWKPSHILGGYEQAMAEARKSGELAAQIGFEGKLKQIETAAVQWQEEYKTAAAGVLRSYDAAYSRAGIYAQATADIQKQYVGTRYQLAAGSVGGELQVANMATLFGAIGGFFDPNIEESANAYADRMRQRAYTKLDEAAQSGVTVSVDGWNTGLPAPDSVARELRDLPPLRLPGIDVSGSGSIDPKLRGR